MLEILKFSFEDAVEDSLKLLPFLFVTYLIMEALERASRNKNQNLMSKAGKASPLIGAVLGAFPQCGFSAAASNLYSAGFIGMGTLISVFMSTSDEMLPVFIAEKVNPATIFKLLGAKIVVGAITGFLVSLVILKFVKKEEESHRQVEKQEEFCSHCHNHSIIKCAAGHTVKIFIFIFIITMVINVCMEIIGETRLTSLFNDLPVVSQALAGLIGLIPNCAASVVISQLYIDGIISSGTMFTGLLVSAGVGLLVLFKENKNRKDTAIVIGVLYGTSLIWGLLVDIVGIVF